MTGYIRKAARSLHDAGDPAAGDWAAVKALAILAGDSDRVARDITAGAGAAGLTGAQRAGAGACARYLSNGDFNEYRDFPSPKSTSASTQPTQAPSRASTRSAHD